jgi:hypothetical protein
MSWISRYSRKLDVWGVFDPAERLNRLLIEQEARSERRWLDAIERELWARRRRERSSIPPWTWQPRRSDQ